MTSEAQKNAGYLIPTPITGYELLCVQLLIPNDQLYIAAFTAQLWDLGTWFTWEKSYTAGDTRASQAAAYWRYLLETYLCIQFNKPREDDSMPCCDDKGERLTRFTSDGVWEVSDDNGATWHTDPGSDPRNDATNAPPLPGSGDSTQCAAADNARDQFKAIKATLRSLLESGTTVLAIIAGIIGALGVLMGISIAGTAISVLLFGMSAALLSLTPEGLDAALTDAVFDDFRCILYCNMQPNGQFTYDNWVDILSQIDSTFTGFPQLFFHSIVAAMGYIGLSNAGTVGPATADDCDCDCVVDCGDNWSPIDTTTFVGTFAGYKRFRSAPSGGTMILGIRTPDIGTCCKLIDWRYVGSGSGTVVAQGHIDCGDAIDGANIRPGWGLEGCYNWMYAQAATGDTSTYFEAEFLFADC